MEQYHPCCDNTPSPVVVLQVTNPAFTMLKHATTLTVIGFLLFFLGLVSILLNMVGVDIFFMSWIYELGVAFSFGLRLLMIIVGLILIYLGQTDWEREEI